jgi:ABC-2 type transport system permease protein
VNVADGARPRFPGARGSIRRTLAIAGKEIVQLRRDVLLGGAMLLFPLVLLLFFGFALNLTLDEVPVAVVDPSGDRVTAEMVATFERVAGFVAVPVARVEEGLARVRAGEARAVLVLPAAALETVRAGGTLTVGFHLDDADPSMAAQVSARAAAAAARFTERLLATRGAGVAMGALPLRLETTRLYNPEARSAVFMVPALIGLILTLNAALLTAIVIVREREGGTMEALLAAPVRPAEVVVGKVLPYFGFGLVSAAMVLAVGILVFAVPMRGDWVVLVVSMVLFVLGSLGIGILISTLARTQMQAMFGTLAYVFPSLFLSGFYFPIEGMPPFFQAASSVVPLRYFNEIARAVMLRGVGFEQTSGAVLALALFAVVMLVAASLRMRTTL